jgi:nickel-dependent lactate racemase
MVEIWLPYGKTEVPVRIPDENLLGVIEPKEKSGIQDPKSEIQRALANPIGSKPLHEIAKPGDKVAIVVDDATRPAPSHIMMPPILDELRKIGVKDEDITIIFACGNHRPVKPEEIPRLIGDEIAKCIKTLSHDCKATDLVNVGTTSFGTPVYLNPSFVEANVRILTGDIELHYYAGYGGGRKSVLPGIAGSISIQKNHALLLHPNARTGVLDGNPVHQDMTEAIKFARVDFVLNTVMNAKKEIVTAFAGDVEKAFLEGVKLVDDMYKVQVDKQADIVITAADGSPHDIDLYQAHKAVDSVLDIVKQGGVIILVAECREGYGNQVFYDWMTMFKTKQEMEKEIKRHFMLGGHKAYYLTKTLEKAKVILVSTMPDYYATGVFRLKTAKTVNNALQVAFNMVGKKSKVWVVPHGSITLPILTGE